MRKYVLPFVALAAMPIATASADEMAVRGPLMPVSHGWTGFYLGGEVGGGWSSDSVTIVTRTSTAFPAGTSLSTLNNSGVLGGLYGGYTYQMGFLVFGFDGEYNWADLAGSSSTRSPTGTSTSNVSDKVTWISTVTGRFGLGNDDWLFFVKGGGAWAEFSSSSTTVSGTGAVTGRASSADLRSGWTVGSGVEYRFAAHWSLKLEYDYIGFSSANFSSLEVSGAVGARSATSYINEAKGGVSYRF
jgi:outer membrane immunogenic protein